MDENCRKVDERLLKIAKQLPNNCQTIAERWLKNCRKLLKSPVLKDASPFEGKGVRKRENTKKEEYQIVFVYWCCGVGEKK